MNSSASKIIIVHNIIAPYKVALFNEINKYIPDLKVIFIAEKESRRDWNIDYSKIKFSYDLLFQGAIDDVGFFKIAKSTWRILQLNQPKSLIICDYSNIFGWVSLLWGKINKSKLIFWLASTREDRKHYFPKEQIKHFFLKYFDLYLSPGTKTFEYLEYMGVNTNKIIKTGYGVENSFYLNEIKNIDILKLKNSFNYIKTDKNFLYVGRLSPEKNIFTMLESFKNVSNIDKNWGLIILGSGTQKDQISKYIKNNNLMDRIYLLGFIQQSEIAKYYAFSDIFILPSTSEPWGLVVNEAMLSHLPVIVSDKCGCTPELVKNGVNGFTFNPYDQKKLENIMENFILKIYDIGKLGENSLNIVKKHSPDRIAKVIYNNLINQRIISL